MSARHLPLLGLVLLGGCVVDGYPPMSPVPAPMPAPAVSTQPAPAYPPAPVYASGPVYSPTSPGYTYVSGPAMPVEAYQQEPAPSSQPIRAPQTVLPGQGLYGTDPGLQGMAEGNTGQAEVDFEKALDVNPFDPVALNNLAVAKAERGQFHEATALLERAAKLQPNNAEVVANLARLRGYVQGYAMAGVSGAMPKSVNGPLPPPPPSLWGSYQPAATATTTYPTAPVIGGYGAGYVEILPPPSSEALVMPAPQDGYYQSEACKRVVKGSGKNARVEIECEPRR